MLLSVTIWTGAFLRNRKKELEIYLKQRAETSMSCLTPKEILSLEFFSHYCSPDSNEKYSFR